MDLLHPDHTQWQNTETFTKVEQLLPGARGVQGPLEHLSLTLNVPSCSCPLLGQAHSWSYWPLGVICCVCGKLSANGRIENRIDDLADRPSTLNLKRSSA